jgi:inosose dehydratase
VDPVPRRGQRRRLCVDRARPYGYLPTEPGRLSDELASRGLRLSGGTLTAGLHHGPDALAAAIKPSREVAALVTRLGARHIVDDVSCHE